MSERPLENRFNVVVFGETGAGKSSLINMLIGSDSAVTSNTAVGCTTTSQPYDLSIKDIPFRIWDTAGLNETDKGTVAATTALDQLGQLLGRLNDMEGGIHLLLYCVAGVGFRAIMRVNYDLVWGIMCQMQIPVVVVVTKQEHADGNQWWNEHGKAFAYKLPKDRYELAISAICVTTTRGKNNLFDAQYTQSTYDVQESIVLAVQNSTVGKIERDWFSSGGSRKMTHEYLHRFQNRTNNERAVFVLINKRLKWQARQERLRDVLRQWRSRARLQQRLTEMRTRLSSVSIRHSIDMRRVGECFKSLCTPICARL